MAQSLHLWNLATALLNAPRILRLHPSGQAEHTEDALPVFAKNVEIHQLANSTRKEFFEKLIGIFIARYDK
jgi:hypothetical protein